MILGKGGRLKKPATLYVDRGRIERHILPLLGTKSVRKLETDPADIEAGVQAMADEVWAWCEKARAFGRTVTVKIKYADFRQITHSRTLHDRHVWKPCAVIFVGGSSLASGTTPAGPRISLAVCAKAPDVHKANAIATRGIRIVFIANAPELLSLGLLGLTRSVNYASPTARCPLRNSIMCLGGGALRRRARDDSNKVGCYPYPARRNSHDHVEVVAAFEQAGRDQRALPLEERKARPGDLLAADHGRDRA